MLNAETISSSIKTLLTGGRDLTNYPDQVSQIQTLADGWATVLVNAIQSGTPTASPVTGLLDGLNAPVTGSTADWTIT
jgi:hypothetical protein